MILATSSAFYLACAGLAAGALEHDPFSGAAEVVRYSFESDEDRDFDDQPDDWIRRKGPSFPTYVETGIDRLRGSDGKQSLRFKVNGGKTIIYSPPVPIDALHAYVFEGSIRTQMLKHDAALLSVSFLNHKRQRIQRFLSKPVSGTHQKWVHLKIGPMAPQENVSFVVIGCHLVQGNKMDIRGTAWFDDLKLGKVPQLSFASNIHSSFVRRMSPIQFESRVSGLDAGHRYQLRLQIMDSTDRVVSEIVRDLDTKAGTEHREVEPGQSQPAAMTVPGLHTETWRLPPQPHGFYRARARLERDGEIILDKQTAFAVIDRGEVRDRGEFGWTIAEGSETVTPSELADIASQSGINWLKYPVWQSVYSDDPQVSTRIAELFDLLVHYNITPIGLLNSPPSEMRNQFARDWTGISEIFMMPPSFWERSLEPVIARYSSYLRHWQLGSESDNSFVGLRKLPKTLANVKRTFDKIGRDTRIGLHWDWETPVPSQVGTRGSFLSISADDPLPADMLMKKLMQMESRQTPRWVVIKPLARSKNTSEERGADLVRGRVAAKIGRAEAIFAWNVFDPEHGLLNKNGSPTLLYLPWRTTAVALRGAEYLGSINMPGGSYNHAFANEDEMVLIVWSDEPQTEEIYLGEQVIVEDVWGRQRAAQTHPVTKRQILHVSPTPLILRGCSGPVARWRIAARFEKGRLPSRTGKHRETILGMNTFPSGVSFQVVLNVPKSWKTEMNDSPIGIAAGEKFSVPLNMELPSNTSLGDIDLSIDFEVEAEQPYKFRVYRPYKVGLDDVTVFVIDKKLPDGRLKIDMVITNRTSPTEILNFACSLYVPGRRRDKRIVTKLGNGQDKKVFYLPNADALRGKRLWIKAEQSDGLRVLNFRWTVGENWNTQNQPPARPNPNPTGKP